jgi:hypothetical protein
MTLVLALNSTSSVVAQNCLVPPPAMVGTPPVQLQGWGPQRGGYSFVPFDVTGLPSALQDHARIIFAEMNAMNTALGVPTQFQEASLSVARAWGITVETGPGEPGCNDNPACSSITRVPSGQILKVKTTINLGGFAPSNLGGWRYFDPNKPEYVSGVETVLRHEILHTLGVGDMKVGDPQADSPYWRPLPS